MWRTRSLPVLTTMRSTSLPSSTDTFVAIGSRTRSTGAPTQRWECLPHRRRERVLRQGQADTPLAAGTGFEFTTSPWIYYEAMDIKVVNNIIHDTEGAGLGVNGGYNILMAYNTMYRVGQRSHVVEFVFGAMKLRWRHRPMREPVSAGGWGTSGSGEAIIPNKHVYFYNNVVLNPAGYQSQWQQFAIYGPRSQPSGAANAPDPRPPIQTCESWAIVVER